MLLWWPTLDLASVAWGREAAALDDLELEDDATPLHLEDGAAPFETEA